MRRADRQNIEWLTPQEQFRWEHVQVEVLMDIREQLRALNATLSCYRVREMADACARIDKRLRARGYSLKKAKK